MAEVVDPQIKDALTVTNVKSWHDVHMGVAAGMAGSHATNVDALNKTFVTNIGVLQKRIVEPDIAEASAQRLVGGAGQSAVQGDQASSLATIIEQLGAAIGALQQILKGAQTTIPETGVDR